MHAIGARPRDVRRIVTAQGIFLALASCLLAAIPALVHGDPGRRAGRTVPVRPAPFRISGLAVGIWVALVVPGAILATEAAATRASRITVREALAYL